MIGCRVGDVERGNSAAAAAAGALALSVAGRAAVGDARKRPRDAGGGRPAADPAPAPPGRGSARCHPHRSPALLSPACSAVSTNAVTPQLRLGLFIVWHSAFARCVPLRPEFPNGSVCAALLQASRLSRALSTSSMAPTSARDICSTPRNREQPNPFQDASASLPPPLVTVRTRPSTPHIHLCQRYVCRNLSNARGVCCRCRPVARLASRRTRRGRCRRWRRKAAQHCQEPPQTRSSGAWRASTTRLSR